MYGDRNYRLVTIADDDESTGSSFSSIQAMSSKTHRQFAFAVDNVTADEFGCDNPPDW